MPQHAPADRRLAHNLLLCESRDPSHRFDFQARAVLHRSFGDNC